MDLLELLLVAHQGISSHLRVGINIHLEVVVNLQCLV